VKATIPTCGIHTLADFFAIVIYTNLPSGVVAYLVETLVSINKLCGAIAGDINLVARLVSVNSNQPRLVPHHLTILTLFVFPQPFCPNRFAVWWWLHLLPHLVSLKIL
jgi:hypothetical protein